MEGLLHHAKMLAQETSVTCAGLLEGRIEGVYRQAPGYSEKATSLFVLDLGPPQDLPDALRGESWLFVQLPLSTLREELRSVTSRAIFGDTFSLGTAGLSDLSEDTLIPGAPLCQAHLLVRREGAARQCCFGWG